MGRPWTVTEILNRRTEILNIFRRSYEERLKQAQGSLSDVQNQTTSINIPPPPEILSIVSWNVQTFEAGKSLSNPFVNIVINRILEALSVDICILLETRADSYINMNAIESGHQGSGKWTLTEGGEDDEEPDEVNDDQNISAEDDDDDTASSDPNAILIDDDSSDQDDDDPDTEPPADASREELDGGEPLRYIQVVSEMTGKRWVPPPRICVYHPYMVDRAKLVKDYARLRALIDKLLIQTGRTEARINQLLASAAAKKRKDGKAELEKFIDSNVASQKGRKKKLTVKEKPALLRMYSSYMKNPTRFASVTSISQADIKFCESYERAAKWSKSQTVTTTPPGPSDQWKTTLFSEEMISVRTYYEPVALDNSLIEQPLADWSGVTAIPASDNWRFSLKIRRCPGCNATLGTGECDQILDPNSNVKCADLGPLSHRLGILRQSINSILFYRGSAQESYSLLVRPSTSVSGAQSEGVWLNGKQVKITTIASKLLMREPDIKQVMSGGKKPVYKSGKVLGYQDGKATFYGRCPFAVPLSIWLPLTGAEERMPLIAFHGPYGKSTLDGVKARADSMTELMKAGVGADNIPLKDAKNALIMGDFNLDYHPSTGPDTQQKMANDLYSGFTALEFKPMVADGVATSLISIHGKAQAWTSLAGTSAAEFTSSAYDNLFLKGELMQKHHVHSAVIDVISWIEDNLADFQMTADQNPPDHFSSLPAKSQAFYIYHRYVSDHLPILCDLLVQGMPDNSTAARTAVALRDQIRRQAQTATRDFRFDVVMNYESILDISPADSPQDSYTKEDKDPSRYAHVTGTIVGHQDGHLVIQCSPDGKSSLWMTYQPQRNGKPAGGKLLQVFLQYHPPGMRVAVDVLNPSWIAVG